MVVGFSVIRFLWSNLSYLVTNAVGILIVVVLFPGFTINALAFVIAVAIFSIVQSVPGR